MSLIDVEKKQNFDKNKNYNIVIDIPVFYFIYNTDNYYHFIYDTLPYLISFNHLKNKIPNLKLLMNYSNKSMDNFYLFVKEFLEILNIRNEDIIIVNDKTLYTEIYISTSYTHDFNSNLPPRKEIYSFYKEIVRIVNNKYDKKNLPKNIYVSRRTWIHNDLTNIGTNYTTRRKLINENELVDFLNKNGYVEIFTETLSTIDKILLFSNVKNIVGAIGGGICNVLFSNKETKLTALVSPTFLDINQRFKFSLEKVNTTYFMDTKHSETDYWKKYMRVKTNDIIGEIEEVYVDSLLVTYTDEFVAGWNFNIQLKNKLVKKENCQKLDNGLNSSWVFDINKLII
jgi:capsular polysaccharide biosynthesis protein